MFVIYQKWEYYKDTDTGPAQLSEPVLAPSQIISGGWVRKDHPGALNWAGPVFTKWNGWAKVH